MQIIEVNTPTLWLPLFVAIWMLLSIVFTKWLRARLPIQGRVFARVGGLTLFAIGVAVFVGKNSSMVRLEETKRWQGDTIEIFSANLQVRKDFDWEKRTYTLADLDFYDIRRPPGSSTLKTTELTLGFTDGYTVDVGERMTNFARLRSYLERRGIRKRMPNERPRFGGQRRP